MNDHPWTAWVVSAALASLVLLGGGWKALTDGDPRSTLLAMLFISEALVWSSISRVSGTQFLTGVYVFHIAAGSYYHYLGSYIHARAKGVLSWSMVVAINVAVIALGVMTLSTDSLSFLRPLLGVEWFTLWVGMHLVSSEVFPLLRNWRQA